MCRGGGLGGCGSISSTQYPVLSTLYSVPCTQYSVLDLAIPFFSVQVEVYFHRNFDTHGLAVFLRWLELPGLDGLHGLLIETISERSRDMDVRWEAVLVYDEP